VRIEQLSMSEVNVLTYRKSEWLRLLAAALRCPERATFRAAPNMTHSSCLRWSCHLPCELCVRACGQGASNPGVHKNAGITLWRLYFGSVCHLSLWMVGNLWPKDGAETMDLLASAFLVH